MKKIIFTILVLLFTSTIYAQDGLALMKTSIGARSAGLGDATVAMTDDPVFLGYNPAAINNLENFIASLGHTSYWENVRQETGIIAGRLSNKMFFHAGIRFAVVDDIEQRLFPTPEPLNYFDAHDVSFKGGLAYRSSDKLTFGVAMGWLIEKIEAWNGSAFNFDLGINYRHNASMSFGASVVNMGGDITLSKNGFSDSRPISLPTRYALGGLYKYKNYTGSADLVYLDDEMKVHLGAEGKVHEMFSIRSGLMLNYDSKNISAGASFHKRNLTIDYAFVPFSNDLGSTHMFNFTFSL